MKTLQVYDSNMQTVHLSVAGEGSEGDPFVLAVADTSGGSSEVGNTLSGYNTIDSALRVGILNTLGDYKQLTGKDTILFDEKMGGTGTSIYLEVDGGVKMSVSSAGDYVIRETKLAHNYTSGNPQIFEQTTIDLTPVAGVVKQLGYFCSSTVAPYSAELDGLLLETDDTDLYFKAYKRGVETFSRVRSGWDDPLDGSGPSGVTLNPAGFQAMVCEFLYLGGTVARFGFLIGDRVVWAHTFENSNVKGSTIIGTPVQPLRWSIRSTGGVGSLYHICGKVGTIGAVNASGITRLHDSGSTFINADTVGTTYAIMAVKPNNRSIPITVSKISGLAKTADNFLLELRLNPSVAGTFTYSDSGHGHDEAIGDPSGSNVVTGGIKLGGDYIHSSGSASIPLDNLLGAGCSIDGVHDALVLCVTPLGANLDVYGAVSITIQP